MYSPINCIIVDDEPSSLKGLSRYVNRIDQLKLIGLCENSSDAELLIKDNRIDIMFLDINMPGINGIEFLRNLKEKPITIITTAYSEYAIESFELDVIDYLVKPFSFERFEKATIKAIEYFELIKAPKANFKNYFFLKSNKKIIKLLIDEIFYVEALHNYIAIYTDNERHISYMGLKDIENYLPKDRFIKVQRSFIVAKSKVSSISDGKVIIKNREISISRSGKQQIINSLLS